ncbi:hypothetical protein [Cytobacillus dafuensis]|uniref:DUF4367 domain-containing protein n=1 Tax=Cytobacillus dafuensis TaxID=1742359 RepID=A0A5B8Z5Z5_CYTDA|nr:hypothetical protein [Cytobacillus dafuensis]QED48522.1 hypothetical protein FSZ17_15420 [Cytobacillus dafuensis]
MKDKIKSFEEFENRFKNQRLPKVEHNEYLAVNTIEHKKTPIFLRASFITIFLTLFISVSIAAAMHFTGWKFFNSDGKQVFEMNTMTEEEAKPHHTFDEIYAEHRDVMDEIRENLQKGEFKYFLSVEGYEKIGVSALTMIYKGEEIKTVTQIPNDMREFLNLKDELQNKYILEEGMLYYELPWTDSIKLAKDMYKEAKEKNLEYIEKAGKRTSDITDISNMYLHYTTKSNEEYSSLQIIITPVKKSIHTTEDLAGYIQLTEDGVDFLYSKDMHHIYFVKEDNSKKFLINISTSWSLENFDENEEKEKLIEIAKTFLN